jgi:hypothetical protein
MAKENPEELLAEIARLKEALGVSEVKRTEAEEMAFAMSQASQFSGSNVEEHPTGKTVTVSKCVNPTERTEKKQKWIDVEMPTYAYRIDIPKGAGIYLSTNGVEYYHGQSYEFDGDSLAEMKSRVARCWDHEKSIHGENENAYRKPTNRQF